MWSSPFAARRGPAVVEILRLTGYRSWSEFIDETTPLERRLITRSIERWHDEKSSGAGGGGGSPGPPGL